MTEKLVQIANSCCQGRVVSVLEGGYQLGGEFYSAFAQSAKVPNQTHALTLHTLLNICFYIHRHTCVR